MDERLRLNTNPVQSILLSTVTTHNANCNTHLARNLKSIAIITMSDAVSASILRFVLRDLKTQQQQQPANTRLSVSDTHGQVLAALPAADLALLQSASQLVHRGAVKRVTAEPSRRSFFRVESLNRYHKHDQQHVNANNDTADASYLLDTTTSSQPFDGALVRGRGPNFYNVLPHYCSCQTFHEHTVVQSPIAVVRYIYIQTYTCLLQRVYGAHVVIRGIRVCV